MPRPGSHAPSSLPPTENPAAESVVLSNPLKRRADDADENEANDNSSLTTEYGAVAKRARTTQFVLPAPWREKNPGQNAFCPVCHRRFSTFRNRNTHLKNDIPSCRAIAQKHNHYIPGPQERIALFVAEEPDSVRRADEEEAVQPISGAIWLAFGVRVLVENAAQQAAHRRSQTSVCPGLSHSNIRDVFPPVPYAERTVHQLPQEVAVSVGNIWVPDGFPDLFGGRGSSGVGPDLLLDSLHDGNGCSARRVWRLSAVRRWLLRGKSVTGGVCGRLYPPGYPPGPEIRLPPSSDHLP
uniref:C2H2-type domain-containing protein n=1 Tax=Mycena chlorophos TaxID=658473 RepID=A0ABQ0L3T9_MYCCL|nr:predicted protein [Mycena chlorophos]